MKKGAKMKKDINEIKEIEFACTNCCTKITFSVARNKMFSECPSCGYEFSYDAQNDPLRLLNRAFKMLKDTPNLAVSFICDEKETK